MKKSIFKLSFLLFSVTIILGSCSQSKFIVAPPFTDVDKISKIEVGQTKDNVSDILGIQPYDILYLDGGNYMCYYNYRLLDRMVAIDNRRKNIEKGSASIMASATGNTMASEKAQTIGVPFYTEWKKVYVNFENGAVSHYVTDVGVEDANYLGLVNGTIKLLNSKDIDMKNFFTSKFCCPSSSVLLNTVPLSTAPSNTECPENEYLDLDKVLFPLKYNGKFKSTDSPRKKKGLFSK